MRALGVGSYYEVSNTMYQPPPAANPGWAIAPVPGWGTNPDRSGPSYLATNGMQSILPAYTPVRSALGDAESDANQGYIALAAAGGILLGWFLAWAYHYHLKPQKKGQ